MKKIYNAIKFKKLLEKYKKHAKITRKNNKNYEPKKQYKKINLRLNIKLKNIKKQAEKIKSYMQEIKKKTTKDELKKIK